MKSEIRYPNSSGSLKSEARSPRSGRRLVRDSVSGFRISAVLLVGFIAASHVPSAAGSANASSAHPSSFFRLRESTLGYHGPSVDFTNLTEIRIGWFGPTNVDDPLTGDLWWAANVAIREANGQSDWARNAERRTRSGELRSLPFRLLPRWAMDPWGTGVSQLARMVYDEQPLALLGSVDSASTHLAEQIVAKAQLPLVSPIVTDKSVTLAGVSWMFSCAPSDAAIARVLVEDILATLNDSAARSSGSAGCRLALITCTDHESRMMAREVVKELSQRASAPDFRFEVPAGAQDIAQQFAALEASHPNALLILAGAEDAARLVRAARKRLSSGVRSFPRALPLRGGEGARKAGDEDSECFLFGSHTMGRTRFRELAGPAAEGVRFPLLYASDSADTNSLRFRTRFVSERNRPPDYTAVLTYDATRLLIAAVRRAGPNRARIREALTQLSPWPGIAGPIHFDGTGQNTRTNICMGTIQNGAVVPLPARTNSAHTASKYPSQ